MIDNPTEDEKHLIWGALVHAISSNSGMGFSCNNDQGHPHYRIWAEGGTVEGSADAPETNCLFNLLASFDPMFHQEYRDLSTWEKFCGFAVESYDRAHRSRENAR